MSDHTTDTPIDVTALRFAATVDRPSAISEDALVRCHAEFGPGITRVAIYGAESRDGSAEPVESPNYLCGHITESGGALLVATSPRHTRRFLAVGVLSGSTPRQHAAVHVAGGAE